MQNEHFQLTKISQARSIKLMSVKLSIVIPIYNEEKNIHELYRRLKGVVGDITKEHELIFINDGSKDDSLNLLCELHNHDSKVKIINFSRNFGHMPAIDAGLTYCSGEKIVIMDADLQDPPEVISKMWGKSEEGYDVVFGVKEKRKESILRKFLFSSFYRLLDKVSEHKMPLDAGTFSLIDKKIVKILNSLPERNKYFSGLRSWTGFKQTGVVYERGARFAGQEASLSRLIKLALDGMVSFSYIPLRLASFLGFIFATLAFAMIFFVIVTRIFFGFGIVGWASTISTVLLIGGVQLITLGIIGEYLARIYDEVKNRPEYIVAEKVGF